MSVHTLDNFRYCGAIFLERHISSMNITFSSLFITINRFQTRIDIRHFQVYIIQSIIRHSSVWHIRSRNLRWEHVWFQGAPWTLTVNCPGQNSYESYRHNYLVSFTAQNHLLSDYTMFSGAKNTMINGGTFTTVYQNTKNEKGIFHLFTISPRCLQSRILIANSNQTPPREYRLWRLS